MNNTEIQPLQERLDKSNTTAGKLTEALGYIDDLKNLIRDYKKVTEVLGAGIGKISVPDNFFALWNETEIKGSRILHEVKK